MLGACSYILDNGQACNKAFQLHTLFFNDPYSREKQFTDLCKWHYDLITGEMVERVRDFQMKLTNLIAESARLRKIARENDTGFNNERHQQRIIDLKELIRKVQSYECKNYFCNNDLTKLERFQKLYSCHTFKPSGRRHYSFYYCCMKCYNIMRGKCGLKLPISSGQTVLD